MSDIVVDNVENDNDEDEDQIENHVDVNVVNEDRVDEEFDVKNAVNLLAVDDVVVKVLFVVDAVDRGNENVEDNSYVDQDAWGDVNVNQNTNDDVVDDDVEADLLINGAKTEGILEVVANDNVNEDEVNDDADNLRTVT